MKKPLDTHHLGILCILLLVAAVGALVFTACSDSSSPTEPVADAATSGGGTDDSGSSDSSDDGSGTTDTGVTGGSLLISMTDAPTDEICQLVVYIEELRVKKEGSPPQALSPTDGLGGYDLLLLQGGNEVSLGQFDVEATVYQFIEMLLDETNSYVVEKIDPTNDSILGNCEEDESPLKIPSAKFKINGGPFEVDEHTEVLIDFNAKNSLKSTGNGKTWQLKADVSIAEVDP
jgi:hypothetical protein